MALLPVPPASAHEWTGHPDRVKKEGDGRGQTAGLRRLETHSLRHVFLLPTTQRSGTRHREESCDRAPGIKTRETKWSMPGATDQLQGCFASSRET